MDRYAKSNNAALVILAGFAIGAALIYTKSIMLPFVFSLFLYAVLSPMLQFLHVQWKLPHWLAMVVTALSFAIVISILALLIANSLQDFYLSANEYRARFVEFIGMGTELAGRFGIAVDPTSIRSAIDDLPTFKVVQSVTGGVMGFLGNLSLVILFTLFLILSGGKSSPSSKLAQTIQSNVSSYVATKLAVSLATGTIVGLLLWIFNVELAFMFAVLTVLLNFIPSIGSLIATVLPLPIILLQFGFGWQFWILLILSAATQFAIGNVIEPKLMGDSLDLHPVTVLICLMFWGLVWGVAGMFLAVPITALIKIVLQRIEATQPLAQLLAGKLPA